MDINHIHLNQAAVAGLYKNHLVESGGTDSPTVELNQADTGDMSIPEKKAPPLSIKSLGNNERKVLILVLYPDIVFLPDEELKFLTGILAACKLSMADVAVVNLNNCMGTGYKELLTFFNSTKMLLFGLEPSAINLPVSFPPFQLQAFNGTTYHWCPDLGKMENDRALKTQLWNNLKKLFTI